MRTLTSENIRFIERYLDNSGVEYADIRIEMTDHVASEIESKMAGGDSRGFYLIFKEYMVSHKSGLLGSLKKFRKEADRKVTLKVFRNLYHPKTLLLTVLASIGLYFVLEALQLDPVHVQWYFILGILGLYFIPFVYFGKKQYIYLNRLSFRFGLGVYLLHLPYEHIPFLQNHSLWYFSAIILLLIAVLRTLFDLVFFYKKNYKLS